MTNWQYERTMTPVEYGVFLELLGLSQLAAGRWLGVSPRTSRRYITGNATIPPAQVLLLRAALQYKWKLVVPKRRPGDS
jgi:plasmid maintenance system antidote protein VapI